MSSKKEKVEQLIQDLENGLEDITKEDKYKEYLNAMSKFHNYSARNIILILNQNPNATHIASYDTWKKLGRQVKKGSKGLGIFVPMKFNKNIEITKIDPKTNEPMLDKEGKEIKENMKHSYLTFGKGSVFDISQTDGKELPSIVKDLQGDVNNYDLFLNSLKDISSVPIEFEEIYSSAKGYYHLIDKRIALRKGMSQKQTLKTAIHEISHAEIHNDNNKDKDKSSKEVEAESIAYIVCKNYGLDTSDYSFGYVTGWNKSKDNKIVLELLENIRKQSVSLIDRIDIKFNELVLEKGVNLDTKSILDDVKYNKPDELKSESKKKNLKKVKNINYEMELER